MNETSKGFLTVIIDSRCLLFPLRKRCFVFKLFLYHNAPGYSLQNAELFRVGLVVLEHKLLHPCFQFATVPVERYLANIMSSVYHQYGSNLPGPYMTDARICGPHMQTLRTKSDRWVRASSLWWHRCMALVCRPFAFLLLWLWQEHSYSQAIRGCRSPIHLSVAAVAL